MKNHYLSFILILVTTFLYSQKYALIADRLIDPKNGTVIQNPTVLIVNNKITDVTASGQIPNDVTIIRLEGYTLLPGMINVHTHILSNGGDYEKDLYKNTSTFRALRSVKYLSLMLQFGFTSIRDLGSEGASFVDVDVAKAIDSGFISGPRLFSAGRGIAATGSYVPAPKSQNRELALPAGAQYVSGKEECIKATREQCNTGQKWIKIFADWRNHATFNYDEIKAITEEAKKYKLRVAAHAKTKEAIKMCLMAGVNSIEHGDEFDDELIAMALKSNVFWCPTILGEEYSIVPAENRYKFLNKANKANLKIVCGSDSGSTPWTVNPAKEMELLVTKAGFSPMDAIKTATVNAAELLGKEKEIGTIENGFLADIIGVKGNPLTDITLLQQVTFVMKNGIIYKQ